MISLMVCLSFMVWGGISLEGHTDLHMLAKSTLTDDGYQNEIHRAFVRPCADVVDPGFLLLHDISWPHMARVCSPCSLDQPVIEFFFLL